MSKQCKCVAIFSQRLAGYLLMRGFVMAESRKDYQKPDKNIFFFYESKELRSAMVDFANKRPTVE